MSASGVREAAQSAQMDGLVTWGEGESIRQAACSDGVVTKGELNAARSELNSYRSDVQAVTGCRTPGELRAAADECSDAGRASELRQVASSLEAFQSAVGKIEAKRAGQSRATNWWYDE